MMPTRKRLLSFLHGSVAVALASLLAAGPALAAAAQTAAPAPMDPGWPREVEKDGAKLVYYQPQIDAWKNYRDLTARMAFSLTPKGGKQTVGVASLRARTVADLDAQTVVVQTIQIQDLRFPSLDAESEKQAEPLARKLLPTQGMTVSLHRITAALDKASVSAPPVGMKNDPPPIFSSEVPAVLLFVDGDPIYAPIDGTKLKFVVNTNWDLFWDEAAERYYLLNDKAWLTSATLNGDWAPASKLPPDMAKLPAGQNFDEVKKLVPPPPASGRPPKVFYSGTPAELIGFQGKPVWADVPGTRLVYAKNTDSDVFVHKDESQYYFLVSGRWFRSKTLQGPWTFASANLPKDFAKIPPKGPKGEVLASVPGTQEASDAVLLAQIPTTVVVTRAEAEKDVKVVYDGDPQFKPIEKTSMAYATNTQEKIIKIGDLYYLCFQGVWFMSTGPSGPWKTCDSVPKEIYTIPASSPVHNVTYVTVSNPTTTTVECSHTSGYVGVFVVGMAVGAAIVYGSGWYYPPYVYYRPYYPYPIYRPYPCAYGYGAWYNPATGRYGHGGAVYGPYSMAGGAAWYNPHTGRYGRASTVQTPYGGRTYSHSYNPYTGVHSSRAGGWNPYGSWGSTAVQRGDDWAVSNRVSNSQGTVRHTYGSEGGSATTVRGRGGETVRMGQDSDNNVYAGKDGNVYKKDSSGNWSKYENGDWNNVDKPQGQPRASQTGQTQARQAGASTQPSTAGASRSSASTSQARPSGTSASTSQARPSGTSAYGGGSSDVFSGLNNEASARQRGSERASSYSRSGGSSRSSSRGGGRRH